MYATKDYYLSEYGGTIPAESVLKYLDFATEKIDTATFNRIVAIGFENLTPFQKEKVQKACCMTADFLFENGLEPMAAQSYSVLDISVSVGTTGAAAAMGMPTMAYELLQKTGLCWRGL